MHWQVALQMSAFVCGPFENPLGALMTNAIQEGLQRRLNMPDDEAGSRWKVRGTARVASVAGVMGREFRGPSFTGARRGGARCDCLRLRTEEAHDDLCLPPLAIDVASLLTCASFTRCSHVVHTLFTRCSQ